VRHGAATAAFLLSAAIHAALFAFTLSVPTAARMETVNVEITETARPKPPEAPPPEVKPDPPPKLRSPKVALAPPPQAPPTLRPPPPPPPNAPPPADAPRQVPVQVGISLSSTTEAGGVAAPVGNTLYGRTPEKAPDPAAVRPYRAENYAPPAELTTLPETIACQLPKNEYPEEAKRLGFEGIVRLRLQIDEEGRVSRATVVEDPGHGLAAAALRSVGTPGRCRFRPARKGDRAVATEIPYSFRFELP
jgi:periplasmic protein TonB